MSQGGEQGGDREDNVNMPMAMLVQLQKEFEMLKKNNEEELSMLRAENAHMRRKLQEETVLNSSFETVQPRIQVNERLFTTKVPKPEEDGLKTLGFVQGHLLENIRFMML